MDKKGKIIIYNTEDDQIKIDVKLYDETVWLNQRQMVDLFNKNIRTVNEHIQNVFKEGELSKRATIRNFRIFEYEGPKY